MGDSMIQQPAAGSNERREPPGVLVDPPAAHMLHHSDARDGIEWPVSNVAIILDPDLDPLLQACGLHPLPGEPGLPREELPKLGQTLWTQGHLLAPVVVIFLLLQAAFGSLRLAALTFVLLPMALVGGVLAAGIGGGIISLGSLVGFFTILGIAARNGIMMINHFQHLERSEGVEFGPGLVIRGARERLAPILMTALATGLAIVPLVVGGDLPGHEIEHPMAVVIVGGLLTSTLLNLFVVPSLYLRFGKSWNLFSRPGAELEPA